MGSVLGSSGSCISYEWEITFNTPGGSYTTYSCGLDTTDSASGGTVNKCSTITPTSSSPNFVSAINIGIC